MRQASRQLAATGRPYSLPLHSINPKCNDALATFETWSRGDMSDADRVESDNGSGAVDEKAFSAKLLLPMDRLEAWKTDKETKRK